LSRAEFSLFIAQQNFFPCRYYVGGFTIQTPRRGED
jgi:hypothetical protein